jgi:8-oxo-dGTP diphosphatase
MPRDAYDHPALTADVVAFALGEGELNVLLVQRGKPPFRGAWAFPGGFVNVGESPRAAASRELEEETSVRHVHLEQLRTFGDAGRDPRGHTVTVAYLALMSANAAPRGEAGSDAARVRWWSIDRLPPLAFDHAQILACALHSLYARLTCAGLGACDMLPADLSLGDLRSACRVIARKLEEDSCCGQT